MKKMKIFIADDHLLVREGIKALLQTQPDMEVVGEAGDGREAVEKVLQLRPDVVLMDITMPLMDGIIATHQIKQADSSIQVLVLTGHDNEEYLFHLLQVGGSGYVLKQANMDDLVTAIRAAHRGEVFLYPSVAKVLIADYLQRVQEGVSTPSTDALTLREQEILKLIAEGYTNKEIAQLIHRSIKTVQSHRAHLMEKLNLHDRTEIVRYAIRKGLIEP
ncbi:MAG: response regulator transcription factor [Candidatus Poribacteria bacterium]|nr:response regulator transcription factor [Candidatus Poribacteria bacterium]